MKRYQDVDEIARKADPELQMLLNEVTFGRNLAELTITKFKSDVKRIDCPVVQDGQIIFRTAVYEKGSADERAILSEVALGNTYSDKCLIFDGSCESLKVFEKSESAPKDEE